MRSLALVLATAAASLAAPFTGTSHAVLQCKAAALPPVFVPRDGAIEGTGTFACDAGSGTTSVTVCVEMQLGALGGAWYSLGCATAQGDATSATGTVAVQPTIASGLMRTVATGTNGTVTDTAQSAPILWVNCACAP
jgi:hypothetical protein